MLHSNVMMPSHLAGPDKIVTWGKNEYLNENIALSLNRYGQPRGCVKGKFKCNDWLVLEVITTAATEGVRFSQRTLFYLGRQGDKCVIALGWKEKGFSVCKPREAFTLCIHCWSFQVASRWVIWFSIPFPRGPKHSLCFPLSK